MNIPSHLYKYRSLRTKKDRERTSRIFTHNEIYFAKYKDFNDPFDCNYHISCDGNFDTHKNRLRQLNPDLSEPKLDARTRRELQPGNLRRWKKKVNKQIHKISQSLGIFCMSAKRDNLLLWAHYADCHKGICLEFKVTDGKLFGCDFFEVNYQEPYPNFSLYDDVDMAWVTRYFATKSSDWDYEKEWRICYKESGCQIFPHQELSGVILGAHLSKTNRKHIDDWLNRRKCNVRIYQAHEYEDRFGLDIIPVNQ